MDDRSSVVLIHYMRDALSILEQCVHMYEEGYKSFCRVAAAQLRILVCDTTFRHDRHVDLKPLAGPPQSGESRQWFIDISKFLLPVLKEAINS